MTFKPYCVCDYCEFQYNKGKKDALNLFMKYANQETKPYWNVGDLNSIKNEVVYIITKSKLKKLMK